MKIANGILVAYLTLAQMLVTIKSAFFSINSSKKYPLLVPLVRARNVFSRNSSIKQVELASRMRGRAMSCDARVWTTPQRERTAGGIATTTRGPCNSDIKVEVLAVRATHC